MASADASGSSIEPLFAHSGSLWLRVWATTQFVAIGITAFVVVDNGGGVAAFIGSPDAPRVIGVLALLLAYHLVGLFAHAWILRRTWAVLVFVPLGWAIVVYTLSLRGAFGLLVLGAILQGFIFLPFAWAMWTLAIVVGLLASLVAWRSPSRTPATLLTQVGGIVTMGIMVGTVLLYIHRTNREAAIRARLLRQLDEAQRDLADRARDAGVLEERQRLARDIHDTLAQGFTSVIKHLEAIELSFAAEGRPADDAMRAAAPHLAHAQDVSRTSLAEIRRLVWALTPAVLEAAPLVQAIGRIVEQWSGANGIAATFSLDNAPSLTPDADVIFLRATQESLSNVARHAQASRVEVSFTSVDGLVLLTVEDDGRGFIPADAGGVEKMGLSGMRERVRRFGGHVLIESAPGAGTSVTIAMPLASIAAAERIA